LATALECYEKSEIQNEYSEGYSATTNSTKGLLVWIHNLDENESVVDRISAIIDKDLVYNSIFVLDNKRITFLHICNNLLKTKYQDYNKKFYYIDTGNNPSSLSKNYEGEILPIESIFSDIQIFKLEDEKTEKVILALILNDNFDDNNLRRLIGLSHNLTRNLTANVDIYFPDYDSLHHKNIVAKTKSQFQNNNFTDKVNVFSYNNRFQNIGE
jgi:disulfide oxidoreductase YuzD